MTWWQVHCERENYLEVWLNTYKIGESRALGDVLIRDVRSLSDSWMPVELRLIKEEPVETRIVGDFSVFQTTLIAEEKAKRLIETFITNEVEFLPITIVDAPPEKKFYLMNVVATIDCLDHERSVFTHWSSGEITGIRKAVFLPDCVEEKHIFRIREDGLSRIYVSDAFKKFVEDSELKGLRYDEVAWLT